MSEEKVEKYTKIFQLLNTIAWTIVGFTFVAAIVLYFVWGPSKFFKELIGSPRNGLFSAPSTSSYGNSKQGMMQGRNQQYSQEQIDCAKQVLGQTRVDQILNNNEAPTAKERQKVMVCVSNLRQ